jgi:hypothetical protein
MIDRSYQLKEIICGKLFKKIKKVTPYGLKARRGNEPQGEQEILDLARPDPTSQKHFWGY